MHNSDPGSLIVTGSASVTGYKQHEEDDGTRYICPMYHKTGTWTYEPGEPTQATLQFAYKHEFGDPECHEDALSRKVVEGDLEGTWHDCIELN